MTIKIHFSQYQVSFLRCASFVIGEIGPSLTAANWAGHGYSRRMNEMFWFWFWFFVLFCFLLVFVGFPFVSLSRVWELAATALNKIYRCLTVGSSK